MVLERRDAEIEQFLKKKTRAFKKYLQTGTRPTAGRKFDSNSVFSRAKNSKTVNSTSVPMETEPMDASNIFEITEVNQLISNENLHRNLNSDLVHDYQSQAALPLNNTIDVGSQ